MRKSRIIIGTILMLAGFTAIVAYDTNTQPALGSNFDRVLEEAQSRQDAFGALVDTVPPKHKATVQALLDSGSIPPGVTQADIQAILPYVTHPLWKRRLNDWLQYMKDYNLP